MGAAESKDGEQRSAFARWLDPNGLLLEQTHGWESGTLELAIAQAEAERAAAPPVKNDLALELTPAPESPPPESPAPRLQKSASLLDESMERIAPPVLARWLTASETSSDAASGEELFELRRSRSVAAGVVASLHRRARSLSGSIPELDVDVQQLPRV